MYVGLGILYIFEKNLKAIVRRVDELSASAEVTINFLNYEISVPVFVKHLFFVKL